MIFLNVIEMRKVFKFNKSSAHLRITDEALLLTDVLHFYLLSIRCVG